MPDWLEDAAIIQREYAASTTEEHRRELGQIFTPPEVARYMAELLGEIPSHLKLLDPGTGVGILALAVCERVANLRKPRQLQFVLFETDPRVADLLRELLELAKARLAEAGHSLSYVIHEEDFIAAACPHFDNALLFSDSLLDHDFDFVITNPPYFKLRKDSPSARLMSAIVHGQPNAYAFFMALSAKLLKLNGTLVAISPRSFCNGLYFRGFRKWLLKHVTLNHVHLFESRTDTFKDSGVLQESVITRWHRLGAESDSVRISHSWGKEIIKAPPLEVPASEVVCRKHGDEVIRIPISEEDIFTMRAVESLPHTFIEIGLRISTGPVVMFRATEHLRSQVNGDAVVPLLLPQNVKPFAIRWPVENGSKPVAIADCENSRRILVPVKNYVLLKRFSSKEEKRRLTAGCLIRDTWEFERIGLENHLNYVYHAERELTLHEVYGIAALFNSEVIDRYFRVISGNTQVNATEIRTLSFPTLKTIAEIGRQVEQLATRDSDDIESIVLECLNITCSLNRAGV